MIYREDVSLDEWCKRHDLKVEMQTCQWCKKDYLVNIPFETKISYGLMMEKHLPCEGWTATCRSKQPWNWDEVI